MIPESNHSLVEFDLESLV